MASLRQRPAASAVDMSAKYQRIPQGDPALDAHDDDEDASEVRLEQQRLARTLNADPRFQQPTPAWWKRAALVLFVVVLFWLAVSLRNARKATPTKVVHASRYESALLEAALQLMIDCRQILETIQV